MLTLRNKVLKRLDTYRSSYGELPVQAHVRGYWLQSSYCSLGVVSCDRELFDEPLAAFFALRYQMRRLNGEAQNDSVEWTTLSTSIRESKHRFGCECLGPFRRGSTHHDACGYVWPFLPVSKTRHREFWKTGLANVTPGEGRRWDGSSLNASDVALPSADADYFLQASDYWQNLIFLTRSPTCWTMLERISAD